MQIVATPINFISIVFTIEFVITGNSKWVSLFLGVAKMKMQFTLAQTENYIDSHQRRKLNKRESIKFSNENNVNPGIRLNSSNYPYLLS